jgi:DNA-binding NarL/FixJ family response regulator
VLLEGKTNKEIGPRLRLAEGTLKVHLHRIYRKLGIAIKEVLSADRLYKLTATPATGAKCIELMQRLKPDVAIIDINISHPGATGILRAANVNRWQTQICFLTEDRILSAEGRSVN